VNTIFRAKKFDLPIFLKLRRALTPWDLTVHSANFEGICYFTRTIEYMKLKMWDVRSL